MKRLSAFILFLFMMLSSGGMALADPTPDYNKVAKRIVNESLQVRPGELVLITGTPSEIPIIEELVVEVIKAGGSPETELYLPGANKRAYMEASTDMLRHFSPHIVTRINAVDAWISVNSVADPELLKDVPEEKLAAVRKAYAPAMRAYSSGKFRYVSLGQNGGIPTRSFAQSFNADYGVMSAMFWKAVEASPRDLKRRGEVVQASFTPGSEVHIRNRHGTDLRVAIADLPVFMGTGDTRDSKNDKGPAMTFLPAGELGICLSPDSANGTLAVPTARFRGEVVKNLRMTFKNGRVVSLSADTAEAKIRKFMELTGGDIQVLSALNFGLNPGMRPMDGSDYYSWEMSGMTALVTGNTSIHGCSGVAESYFVVFVPDADIQSGSRRVLKQGKWELAMQ